MLLKMSWFGLEKIVDCFVFCFVICKKDLISVFVFLGFLSIKWDNGYEVYLCFLVYVSF